MIVGKSLALQAWLAPWRALISLIKKSFFASERCNETYDEKLRDFLDAVVKVDIDNLVFLDEAGVNLGMTPLYGRSPKGRRLHVKKSAKRASNISLIGAMKKDGLRALYPYDGPIDGHRFLHFIETQLVPSLDPKDVVVLDNLRVHHIPAAKKLLNDAGIDVIFLPPYSPELNPIENAWSVLKAKIKKAKARTIAAIVDAMLEAKQTLTPEKCYAFIKHAGYDPSLL